MISPRVLLQGKYYPSHVSVRVNPVSNRIVRDDLEDKISKVWEERVREAQKKGLRIWNSLTYRLNHYRVEKERLMLEISTIEFKIRNTLQFVPEFLSLDESYYTKGMFVAGVFKTRDGKYLFGELSGVTTNRNKIEFIGGVASHDEMEVKNSDDLFGILYKELKEEVNVDSCAVQDSYMAGLILNPSSNVGAIFSVVLDLTSEEIKERFLAKNDGEMKSLVFIEEGNLLDFLGTMHRDYQHNYSNLVAEVMSRSR